MSYYGEWPKYVSVAEKKQKAEISLAKLRKKNPNIQPIIIEGRTIAKSWWGKAWNENLESYADYSNRIGRGRSYVRNGAVLDLQISKGKVEAQIQGSASKPYKITVKIDELSQKKWEQITKLCNNRIGTMEQLAEGKFPGELEELLKEQKYGLFPSPEEIHFDCSCPDWAHMCKHVAAALYGIGARLDQEPLLFFELRGIDGTQLIKKTMESKVESMLKNAGKKSKREIPKSELQELFGMEF